MTICTLTHQVPPHAKVRYSYIDYNVQKHTPQKHHHTIDHGKGSDLQSAGTIPQMINAQHMYRATQHKADNKAGLTKYNMATKQAPNNNQL